MAVNALYETMGLTRVISLDPAGRAQIEYAASMAQCHSGGVVQGGFVTGWIDAAMAHAVIAKMGEGMVPMTREQKGHWKSEYSTMVTLAVSGPRTGPLPTGTL